MPGEYLTLDIRANDEASPVLREVGARTDQLERELEELMRTSSRLAGSEREMIKLFKEQARAQEIAASTARRDLQVQAQLVTARAKETTALVKQARETRQAEAAQRKLSRAEQEATTGLKALLRQRQALNSSVASSLTRMFAFDAAVRVVTSGVQIQAEALVDAAKSSLKFEQEIKRVAAVTGGAAGNFETLREAALRGGASTLFTAQQAGEGLRFLAQAGLSADQAARALPSSLQLAAAGVLDLSKAADISTNIMSGYKFEVSELGRVNDVLVKASTSSNTNVQELGTSFSYVAGVAASTGQEFEDITALMEVLANNGIKGSKSGRALANAISRIQKPTAAGYAVLSDLNIELTDAQGRTKNLVTILKEFEAAGASTAQVLSFFGEVAGRSLVTVLNSGTKEVDKFAKANRGAAGTAAEFQRQLQDTASAQLQIFQSTVETAAITVGTRFNPNIKAASKVLTEQVQALLNNNEVLDQFGIVSNNAVVALVSLARVGADVVPVFIKLSGAALEGAKAFNLLFTVANAMPNNLIARFLGTNRDLKDGIQAIKEFSATAGEGFSASSKIADEARVRLSAVADGLSEVREEASPLGDALETLAKRYAPWLKATGLKREQTLADLNLTLADSINIASNAYLSLERNLERVRKAFRGESEPETFNPEQALLKEAELEARIAEERNAERKIALEFELEIFKLRQEGLDFDLEQLKMRKATAKLEEKLDGLARQRTGRRRRGAQVDVASLLAQEELTRRLVTTEDERAKVQLRYEQTLLRIEATKEDASLKASKRLTAEAERDQALQALSLSQAEKLRAVQVEALRLRASLVSESDKLLSIELERQAATLELSGQKDLNEEVRALKEQAIAQKALTEQVKLRKELTAQASAREVTFLRSEASLLERSRSIEDKRAAIALKREAKLAEINASDVEQRTKVNQILLAEQEATEDLLKLKRQVQLVEAERLSSIQQGLAAGIGTDVTGLLGQASGERQGALTDEIAKLQAQQQRDRDSGVDTSLLERRITLLQQEGEAERANLELQKQRLQATEAATTALGTLVLKGAEVAALGFQGKEAYEAMGSAISATAGLGGALASALNLPAKQAAKLQVAFNTAAAIAAGAAYAASGFTAVNLLQAAISHGVAAAKFGVIAGTSAGSTSISRGGVGSGGGGSSAGSAALDMSRERERTAAAFARALRDELSRPGEVTINVDFGSSVNLQQAPDIARQLQRTLGQSAATLYQSQALVRSTG